MNYYPLNISKTAHISLGDSHPKQIKFLADLSPPFLHFFLNCSHLFFPYFPLFTSFSLFSPLNHFFPSFPLFSCSFSSCFFPSFSINFPIFPLFSFFSPLFPSFLSFLFFLSNWFIFPLFRVVYCWWFIPTQLTPLRTYLLRVRELSLFWTARLLSEFGHSI